jgi:thiol-disulfide isomerase/thioredoxin
MKKRGIIIGVVVLVILFVGIGLVGATSVNYFYSPTCPHCERVNPLIVDYVNSYGDVQWSILDVSKGSYNIAGTPTIQIFTSDNRQIDLVGELEIPAYLNCELGEMSTTQCPTTSELNCETQSFFIR